MLHAHKIVHMRTVSKIKKAINLTVDVKLLDHARASDINISAVLDNALRAEMARRWRTENESAIEVYNERVESEGLWCEEYRSW